MHGQRLIHSGFFLLVAATAMPAQAQTADTAKLIACSAKPADADRLACYDILVRGLSAEARAVSDRRDAEGKALAASAAAEAEKARAAQAALDEAAKRDGFGRAQTDEGRIEEVSANIQELLRDGGGRGVFMLDNGQIWRQTEPFPLPPIKAGTAVTLKRGAMGSFRIKIDKINRNIPVIRVR